MKHLKTVVLSFLLSIGFFFPSCDKDAILIDGCDCTPTLFFDIEGLDIYNFLDDFGGAYISPGDTLSFDRFGGMFIDYRTTYHAQAAPKTGWSFSLMNTAYACSCVFMTLGSKTEALASFSLTTLNDFDSDHPAGSDITDLLDIQSRFSPDVEPLVDFLASQSSNLEEEDMLLTLTKAPELNPEFRFKVRLELSTGEVYEAESTPVVIIP